MIEREEVLNDRARDVLVSQRVKMFGDNTRPLVAKEISKILGRHIPITTYTGYETNRNSPLDVKLAICELYTIPLFRVMGLKSDPDKDLCTPLDKAG